MSKIQVVKRNGQQEPLYIGKIEECCRLACEGISDVDSAEIAKEAALQLYNGVNSDKIYEVLMLVAKTKIVDADPNYSFVAAKFLLLRLYKEAIGRSVKNHERSQSVKETFVKNLRLMVDNELLSPKLLTEFNLEELTEAIVPERDNLFEYPGIQTLYDRYFINVDGRRLETPQAFFMRVAMGLCLNEKPEVRNYWVKRIYDKISTFKFMPSSPTLFNSGACHSQLSSCYLSTVEDDLEGIYGTIHGQALLSKYAGGVAVDWTPIRCINSHIKKTNGPSQGLIPWLKQYNDMLVAVNQGSRRKGSGIAYLESWHYESEEFQELRKNTGDDRRRCHDMNTANWHPDLFMEAVEKDDDWYLFDPKEVSDLHEVYGNDFKKLYGECVEKAQSGQIKIFKKVKAKTHWKRMMNALIETGHPWVTFKDVSNIRYPNKHQGVVHSSNLCCVTGDQWVATDEGLFKVEELYKLGKQVKVVGRTKFERASKMELTIKDAKVGTIHTKEGYSHKVTLDHPVWVKDTGWVEAQNLKEGDLILTQQIEGGWGKEDNVEKAKFDGKLYADGQIDFKHVPNYIWGSNRKTVKAFLERVAKRFCITSYKTFAQEIQILFSNFGIPTKFSKEELFLDDFYVLYKTENNFATFEKIEVDISKKEDVYCLMVDSEDRAWTCNGLITKNTEIFLHTKPSIIRHQKVEKVGETAVCSLSSPSLKAHVHNGVIDYDELADTLEVEVRALDNSIDLNYYPTLESENSHLQHRPIGIGLMGWADTLHLLRIPFDSPEATKLADHTQEYISLHIIKNSVALAKERGAYSTYEGSEWSKGKLPIDTYRDWLSYKGYEPDQDCYDRLPEWKQVREDLTKYGIRNACTMAVAPNATSSYIASCSECIAPYFSPVYIYTSLSGQLPICNKYFVARLKELGLWNKKVVARLKSNDGDIHRMDLPDGLKAEYKTAFQIDQFALIDQAAVRQKWMDMGLSLNLYYNGKSLKAVSDLYFYAWKKGLRSTYYLRTKAASTIEKVTSSKEDKQESNHVKECRIDNPECEACQ